MSRTNLHGYGLSVAGAALICIFAAAFLYACSGGGGGGSTDTPPPADTPPITGTVTTGTYNALGMVTDTSGQAVDFAAISAPGATTQSTSSGGAFYGDLATAADGWVHVTAEGYAETYTSSLGTINGARVFTTRLTPLGASTAFTPGIVGSVTDGNIVVDLPAGLFAAQTTIEVTDVVPMDLDASFALMNDDIFYEFVRTFSITARDATGNAAPFEAGQSMPVTITLPAAVAAPPKMAYFDPTTGVWQEVAGICTLTDSTHVSCDLPHLSVWGTAGDTATAGGTPTPPYPSATTREQAKANIRYGLGVKAQGIMSGDAALEAAGDSIIDTGRTQYVTLAQAYAAGHQRDESGKFALLDAEAVNQLLGGPDYGLVQDATTIAENIGTDLLAQDGCGHIRELMQSAAQIELLGGDMGLRDSLLDKVTDAINTCDPWVGTIKVTFDLAGAMPSVPEYTKQASSAWKESHDVRLFGDPSSATGDPPVYTLTGDDVVDISMPETAYRSTLPNPGCPDGYDEYKLYGAPTPATITLAVDGTYSPQGAGFAIASVHKAVLGGPDINLLWSQLLHTYIGASCTLFESGIGPSTYGTGYESIIGGTSIQPTEPISLQEMLNNGSKYSSDVTDTVYGQRTLPLSIPDIVVPWGAVQSVRVYWHFTHIKPQP